MCFYRVGQTISEANIYKEKRKRKYNGSFKPMQAAVCPCHADNADANVLRASVPTSIFSHGEISL